MSESPPSEESNRPGLGRSRSDRVVAGVAGGLGRYFGIDPVIVRIGFVLLTIFGGGGLVLYLLGWLVMAKEGEGDTKAMRALRGSPEGNRLLLFAVLALGAVLILVSPLVWFDGFGVGDGLALPLLLIAAGVAFLLWPDRERNDSSPASAVDGDEVRDELDEARQSFRQRRTWVHGYGKDQPGPPPPKPPKPSPFLGPLTIAVLLVFAGVSLVGEQLDWWDVEPPVYGGITLAIIGVGLLVSAWYGRARGLIFAGLLALPAAWGLAALDVEWHEGIGEKNDTVASLSDLRDEYTFGVGEYEVDLSRVSLDGSDRTIEVGLTIGELTIWVPNTMTVDLNAEAFAGEITVYNSDEPRSDEGFEPSLDVLLSGSEPGRLTLDANLGVGALDVRVCAAEQADTDLAGGLRPCP